MHKSIESEDKNKPKRARWSKKCFIFQKENVQSTVCFVENSVILQEIQSIQPAYICRESKKFGSKS